MVCSGDSRPIWCFTISCSTTSASETVARRFARGGSLGEIPRNSPTNSSASLLKTCGSSATGCVMIFRFIEAGVADEGAEGRRPRNVETGIAVEEPKLENVGAEEPPRRARDRGDGREFFAAGLLLLHEQVGEGIDFRDV